MKKCTKCYKNDWNGKSNTSFCDCCYKEYIIAWRKNNKEKIKESKKKYAQTLTEEQKEAIKVTQRAYYLKNKERYKEKAKEWRKNNLDKVNEARRKLRQIPHHKFRRNLSSRIRQAIKAKSAKKVDVTENLIGCTIEFLRGHLESKFKENMNWDNYGKWHVDHIIPCSSFDLSQESEQRKCFHYTNLQPLWAEENLSKGDKL